MISKVVRIIVRAMSISVPGAAASASRVRSAAAIIAGTKLRMRSARKIGAAARRCQRQRAPSAVRIASPRAGERARRRTSDFSKASASSTITRRIRFGAMTNRLELPRNSET